ncbi:MAG: hypothetical protein JKY96_04710 [Phycisphaerales bacterium]|nr:hypothetical protein [Phycisphaerales bacterium]
MVHIPDSRIHSLDPQSRQAETDLREAIAATTEDRGLFVRELTRNAASLESLFIHLVDTANDPSYSRIGGTQS